MGERIGRRMNDGNMTGMKQDRYRNSEFEYERWKDDVTHQGVSRVTPNTLGVGPFNENRGRRGDEDWADPREDNPFENGKLHNWNHRQGWDEHFDQSFQRGNRSHGGSLRGHDAGGQHRGKGPRGYRRRDESIQEDVCERLSLSPVIDASDIEVDVKEGCVYLKGEVESREIKKRVEFAVENISGVLDVNNQLTIKDTQSRGSDQEKRQGLS